MTGVPAASCGRRIKAHRRARSCSSGVQPVRLSPRGGGIGRACHAGTGARLGFGQSAVETLCRVTIRAPSASLFPRTRGFCGEGTGRRKCKTLERRACVALVPMRRACTWDRRNAAYGVQHGQQPAPKALQTHSLTNAQHCTLLCPPLDTPLSLNSGNSSRFAWIRSIRLCSRAHPRCSTLQHSVKHAWPRVLVRREACWRVGAPRGLTSSPIRASRALQRLARVAHPDPCVDSTRAITRSCTLLRCGLKGMAWLRADSSREMSTKTRAVHTERHPCT